MTENLITFDSDWEENGGSIKLEVISEGVKDKSKTNIQYKQITWAIAINLKNRKTREH